MAWTEVFKKTTNGITISVTKNYYKGKGQYSVKLGIEKKDETNKLYLSTFVPFIDGALSTIIGLYAEGDDFRVDDISKDEEIEKKRIAELAGKRGGTQNAGQGLSRFKKKNEKGAQT